MMLSGTIAQPVSVKLSSTSVTDILSLAAGRADTATVYGALIVNQDSSARKVTLFWTENTTDYAIYESTLGANESVSVEFDAPIKLMAKSTARKIRAQAAAANVVTVTVLYTISSQRADE
jgi:hypothetical protein